MLEYEKSKGRKKTRENMKKLIIGVALVGMIFIPFSVSAQVPTNEELRAQILQLLQQVMELQRQLNELIASQQTMLQDITQINKFVAGVATSTPVPTWVSHGQIELSEAPQKYNTIRNGGMYVKVSESTSTTTEFPIYARLMDYKTSVVKEEKCNCNTSWFPVANEPITITYGDQVKTANTDADGFVSIMFNSIGHERKDYPVKFSSRYGGFNTTFAEGLMDY